MPAENNNYPVPETIPDPNSPVEQAYEKRKWSRRVVDQAKQLIDTLRQRGGDNTYNDREVAGLVAEGSVGPDDHGLEAAVVGVVEVSEPDAQPLTAAALDGLDEQVLSAALEVAVAGGVGDRALREALSEIDEVRTDKFAKDIEKARDVPESTIEKSGFGGPEVEKAVVDYYGDHQAIMSAARSLSGDGAPKFIEEYQKSGDKLIQSPVIANAITETIDRIRRAASSDEKAEAIDALLGLAYTEPSVGALTLTPEDVDRMTAEKLDILQSAGVQLKFYQSGDIRSSIEKRIQAARNEVRPAGQLLFHNTMYIDHIVHAGVMRGREKQHTAQDGKVYTTTAEFQSMKHSFVTHWSERYDPRSYKIPMGYGSNEEGTRAGTVAVPFADMIKRAPYGRGIEYAVVEQNGMVPLDYAGITDDRLVGDIGPGAPDAVGHRGSVDRVFFADSENYPRATDYEIPVVGPEVMKYDPESKAPATATTYLIQSGYDQITTHRHTGATDIWNGNYSPSERESADAVSITRSGAGAGYGYPHRLVINNVGLREESSWSPPRRDFLRGKPRGEYTHGGKPTDPDLRVIQEAQQESIARFPGQYVVPLRAAGSEGRQTDIYCNDATVFGRYGLHTTPYG